MPLIDSLEQRYLDAKDLPLIERVDKANRLAVEIAGLLQDPSISAEERSALTKLRAKVRDVKHWWVNQNAAPKKPKGFPTNRYRRE